MLVTVGGREGGGGGREGGRGERGGEEEGERDGGKEGWRERGMEGEGREERVSTGTVGSPTLFTCSYGSHHIVQRAQNCSGLTLHEFAA